MDEEDGRPGLVARKSGHLNALTGVHAISLRPFHPIPHILIISSQKPSAPPQWVKFCNTSNSKEKRDENLSGK
jgi:hypothetical protein